MPPIDGEILRGLPQQLRLSTWALAAQILVVAVATEITQNYSHVDRIWTFLPPLYSIFYTFYPLLESAPTAIREQGVQPRAVIICALQVLWAFRLTWHSTRRGYFSWTSEDYRWPVFRKWVPVAPVLKYVPRLTLTLFNVGFVSLFQLTLLFALGIPAYAASVSTRPLHWGDALVTGLVLTSIFTEFVADNQQFAYQNFKRTNRLDPNEALGGHIKFTEADRQRGFVSKGLWAYSRHPNCAAEQSIWLFMCLFVPLTNPRVFHNIVDMLTVIAPSLILNFLFIMSTRFTESISEPKYPAYKEYQKRVAMFWPTDTLLKAAWLWVWGQKRVTDELIWGEGVLHKKEE